MAKRPANAGSDRAGSASAGSASAGSDRAGSASAGSASAGSDRAGSASAGSASAGSPSAGPLGAGPDSAISPSDPADPGRLGTGARVLSWLPYLLALAIAGTGLFVAWQGPRHAGHGAGLVGCALLVAAVARLVLPSRYAAGLSSRGRASDVLAFAAFGAAVLVVAITLP
jgi:Protein of unknown function (DUF3017)